MSSESPDQPQQPDPGGATPPPPAGQNPGHQAPPPGYQPPPPGGYQPPPGHQGPAAAYGPPGAQPPLSDSDQRLWATLSHVGGILFGFVPALVVWLVFRERGRYVEEQAKEALNFQLTILIALIIGWILTVIVIGVVIVAAAGITSLVLSIIAAIAANKGEPYRYPFALRLIK